MSASPTACPSTPPDASPGAAMTILIAEDDDGHAELVRICLQEAGVTNPLIRFRNGQEVLDFLEKPAVAPGCRDGEQYVLLLDIRMPKIDGMEVLQRIKALPSLRKMPVVMLTTTDDPRAVDACYALGCSFFICKPVEAQAFFETLRRLGAFLRSIVAPRMGDPATDHGTSCL